MRLELFALSVKQLSAGRFHSLARFMEICGSTDCYITLCDSFVRRTMLYNSQLTHIFP